MGCDSAGHWKLGQAGRTLVHEINRRMANSATKLLLANAKA